MLANLNNGDLVEILQAMIAVERSKGGVIGRAIVISNLQSIMGDLGFLNDVRTVLSSGKPPVKGEER